MGGSVKPRKNGSVRGGGPNAEVTRRSYVAEQYPEWVRANRLRASDLRRLRAEASRLSYRPLISLVLPVYNPEKAWLERALDSVISQVYPDWELCICDDRSTEEHVGEVLSRYERLDGRIRVKRLEQNSGISGSSNAALSLAEGEFVGLLDHDDELPPDALFEVARLLQEHPEADLVYTDEDKIDEQGRRFDPNFKPAWSPDLLLSCNYISHLGVFRRSLLEEIGGFREGFEGCQDFDLVLRFTERTQEIHHVPRVLYHWRAVSGSTAASHGNKDYIQERARRALDESLSRREVAGHAEDGFVPTRFRVRYALEGEPLVSVVVPTRDNLALLKNCIESLERNTDYRNFEVLIVDNDSSDPETLRYLSSTRHRVLRFGEEFNFSRINNFAVPHARGEYVLFLNDDTEAASGGWLEAMLEHAQREEVGAVGARLLYPGGRIQHAGVITGAGHPWQPGVACHSHQHYPADHPGHRGATKLTRNYSAVTAACMMVRKPLFEEMGGFDEENLRINFNDVDLCLRLRERGCRVVYTPYAELYHHESVSRGLRGGNIAEPRYMWERWGRWLANDPFYNPNFSIGSGDYNLAAGSLRPGLLREEEQDGDGGPRPHPLEMSPEERGRHTAESQEKTRGSRRTSLVPGPNGSAPRQGDRRTPAPSGAAPASRGTGGPPFFVLGQPKSGTSWVRSTLDSHPEIVCLGEAKFFGRNFKKGNPSSGGRLPSLYSLFADSGELETWVGAAGQWIEGEGNQHKRRQEHERHVKGLTRAAMDYFFEDARARHGKQIVGDKTPAHTGYMREIHEFYPDARLIHIIRDGRDQAVSSVFHWWREANRPLFANSLDPGILKKKEAYDRDRSRFGPSGESIFTEEALRGLSRGWRDNVGRAMELGPELFGERYFETRYEDLLLEPEENFEAMIGLLGASSDRETVRQCVEKNSFESRARNRQRGVEDTDSFFRKGISGDWKNYFTERDRRIFDEEAGELLGKLGYERDGG